MTGFAPEVCDSARAAVALQWSVETKKFAGLPDFKADTPETCAFMPCQRDMIAAIKKQSPKGDLQVIRDNETHAICGLLYAESPGQYCYLGTKQSPPALKVTDQGIAVPQCNALKLPVSFPKDGVKLQCITPRELFINVAEYKRGTNGEDKLIIGPVPDSGGITVGYGPGTAGISIKIDTDSRAKPFTLQAPASLARQACLTPGSFLWLGGHNLVEFKGWDKVKPEGRVAFRVTEGNAGASVPADDDDAHPLPNDVIATKLKETSYDLQRKAREAEKAAGR